MNYFKKKENFFNILIITFLLTGCYSKEEKELAKKYRKLGRINALNYVKEKYNINAKVISVVEESRCNSVWGCIDSVPNGNVIIKLNANHKNFHVYVTGKYKKNNATDDYQFKEIENDFIKFFRKNIDLRLYDYKFEFNSRGIHKYYNNNLNDMTSYISKVELYYIEEKDLSNLNLNNVEEMFKNHTVPINLINFKTHKKYSDYKNAKFKNVVYTSDNMKNIYKNSMLTLHKGKKTFYKYDNITNYNNDVYVYSSQDNNKYKISLTKLDNMNYFKKLYPDLNDKKLIQVTNAYSIHSSNSLLYIYFPIEKVNTEKPDMIYFISECIVNSEKKYYIESYYELDSTHKIGSVGNFYINQIRYSQCDNNSTISFALIKIAN